ncbi:MAG: translocation/assembly module TamB domain-containing protein [Rubrivivax sp.]
MANSPPPPDTAPGAIAPAASPNDPAQVDQPTAPRRRRPTAWRAMFGISGHLLGALAVLCMLVGAWWWLLRTEPGTAWLMAHLPVVQVEGVQGRVLGDFSAQSIVVPLPGENAEVRINDFAWRGLRVSSARGGAWLRIALDELRASRVELRLGPGSDGSAAPLQAPDSLALPFEFDLAALSVGELHIDKLGEQPLRELRARVHLGAERGAIHRIDALQLDWDRLHLSGNASVATRGELTLQVRLDAEQPLSDGGQWTASARLDGPLAAPQLQATLRAQARPAHPAQSLDLQAELRPFAPWPLGGVQASAKELDLSALHRAAPATSLDIEVAASSTGMDQPAALNLTLDNRRPGLWNEGRLPLRQLRLQLGARPDDPTQLEVRSFEALLGTLKENAGRLTGSGHWNPARWKLELKFNELRPGRLDMRAPVMQLDGQASLDAKGFDSAALSAAQVEARATIEGRLLGLESLQGLPTGQQASDARRVQLKLDALWSPLRIELRQALAQAGSASASASGQLQRPRSSAPWSLKGQATLNEFDPLPWWPGAADSPWRQGPHRLNADARVDLQLPPADGGASGLAMLGAIAGEAHVDVRPSVLAGVPVNATLDATVSAQARTTLSLQLVADGNNVRATAQGALFDRAAATGDDRFTLQADMPTLERLSPLWRLVRGGDKAAKLGGGLSVDAQGSGRWPALKTSGRLDATRLRVDSIAVQNGLASWTLGNTANAPFELKLELDRVAWGADPASTSTPPALSTTAGATAPSLPSLRTVRLSVDGSVAAHRISLGADINALPPLWVDALQPPAAGAVASLSRVRLSAEGGFEGVGGMPFAGWNGVVQEIDVRGDAQGATAWISARDIRIEGLWAGDAGRPARPNQFSISAGQAEILGARLLFEQIIWRSGETPGVAARLQADVRLEPLRVAPLLDRLQPGFGWGGDLQLSGHLKVQSSPSVRADVVIERASGDLTVKDDSGLRSLGLSDLRVGVNAADGLWNFFLGLAGQSLGTASGGVVARAAPDALWPGPKAAIEGVFDLQVADLGIWGPWLPAGWRLDGAVRANAAIAGQFGAPEYTGQLAGAAIGVRNVLQGVQVRDGEFVIALQGDKARIERFKANAGDGTVELRGEASLGEAPRAELQLTLDRFRLLGRVDRRIVTSGQAQLVLGKESLALNGEVLVDEGLIDFSRSDAPTLSEDVQVYRGGKDVRQTVAVDGAPVTVPASKGRKVDLKLRVRLGEALKLRGQGLDGELRGDLLLTAPAGRLQVNGSVRVVNGTYRAYRQKLDLDRGVLSFNGPIENPTLDIEATRPNLDVRVGVAVSGTALVPRIRLFSDTPMSDVEKLSWLLRGRASEGNGADTAVLQAAALAVASGDEPGALDQLLNAFGVDDFSVRDSDGGGGGTVVSVGKQLSRNWYVGYERSLNAATGNFQLIYRIAQRFTVRAQSGSENSISLIWTWRWQ